MDHSTFLIIINFSFLVFIANILLYQFSSYTEKIEEYKKGKQP